MNTCIQERKGQASSEHKAFRKRTRNTKFVPFRKRSRRAVLTNTDDVLYSEQPEVDEEVNESDTQWFILSNHRVLNSTDNDLSHDAITIESNHGLLHGDSEAVNWYRFYLGKAPSRNTSCTGQILSANSCDDIDLHGQVFNKASTDGRSRDLEIRKKATKRDTIKPPLFNGKVSFSLSGNGYKLTPKLELNPTRAVNLQRNHSFDKDTLCQRSETTPIKSLDNNDNVIPFELLDKVKGSSVNEYLNASYDLLQSEFMRALDSQSLSDNPVSFLPKETFNIKRVESYREFRCENSLSLLSRISKTLKQYHKKVHKRTHGVDDERDFVGKSLKLFLDDGTQLIIYAKTLDRIRFEVRHNLTKSYFLNGGHTAPSRAILFKKLKKIRKEAAKRINSVIAFLSEWAEETPKQRANTATFTRWWYRELDLEDDSCSLLSILMEHGLIISRNYFSNKQKSLLNTATRRGIIFYDSVAGAYYPSAIDSSQIPLRRTSLQVLTPACEVSHNAVTQDSQQKVKNIDSSMVLSSTTSFLPSPPC